MIEQYDREGKPISMDEFARLLAADEDYKRVALTQVGPYEISTVWLGIDHGFGRGRPLIFETMVFASPEFKHDMDCRRWHTEAEALAGHEEIVTLVRATTQEEFDEPDAEA